MFAIAISFTITSLMAPRKKKTSKNNVTPVALPSRPVPQRYACSCTQRCKGRLKQLTHATFLKHAIFRENDARNGVQVDNMDADNQGTESSEGYCSANQRTDVTEVGVPPTYRF